MIDRKKQIFLYSSFLIPLIIIFSEISLAIFTTIMGIKIPGKHKTNSEVNHVRTLDPITLSTTYKTTKKDFQNKDRYINRHGLMRTFRSTNKNIIKNVKGIAVLGNSVAAGYPAPELGFFEKSFVNLLEKELIKKDNSIDIVNLSGLGFNSWQENTQLVKYLNSSNNFYDLPNIKLIASLGGIQDFWGFCRYLDENNSPLRSNFHFANGFMSIKKLEQIAFTNSFSEASAGNIVSGFNIFVNSLFRTIKENTYSWGYLRLIKNKINKNKINNSELSLANLESESLSEIVSKKFNISMEEYNQKKSIFIESVIRNFKSMIAINPTDEFLFIYLPTKFSFSNKQENLYERYITPNLNPLDLHIIEADYRSSLIKSLNKLDNLKTYDLADKGSSDWFHDVSHYTIKGHEEISKLILPIFSDVLKKLN